MATQKTIPGANAPESKTADTSKGRSGFEGGLRTEPDVTTELPGEAGLGSGLGSGTSGFGGGGSFGAASGTSGSGSFGDAARSALASPDLPKVSGVIDQVKQQATTRVNEQKARAAEGLGSVASAIRSASEHLRSENQTLATYADKAVDQIQLFADRMRDKEPAEMVRDAEMFARRNPTAFVGGAFVLGLALARFLKSSDDSGTDGRGSKHHDSDFGAGRARSYGVSGETGLARPGSFARVDDLARSIGPTSVPAPGITS